VFVHLKPETRKSLQRNGWMFRSYDDGTSRLMTHWETNDADIELLCSHLQHSLVSDNAHNEEEVDEERQKTTRPKNGYPILETHSVK
jgi:hypothetical protein